MMATAPAVAPLPAAPAGVAEVLALEAYADRLDRARRRLEDDRQAAAQRIAWRRHERQARRQLAAGEIRALTDAGVLAPHPDDLDDHRVLQRRSEQLAALTNLQRLTAEAIARYDHQEATRRAVTNSN